MEQKVKGKFKGLFCQMNHFNCIGISKFTPIELFQFYYFKHLK